MGEISGPESFRDAFSVSRETIERLKLYARLLQHWQKTINLVAPGTLDAIWARHFADSAQILRLGPPAPQTWIDLGSGGGFPGLVVATLLAEAPVVPCTVTLIESDSRKAAFLRETARELGLSAKTAAVSATETRRSVGRLAHPVAPSPPSASAEKAPETAVQSAPAPPALVVDILPLRAESAATRASLHRASVVSGRALAPMPRLLALAQPFFGPDTVGLFLKGREVSRECQAAELEWNFEYQLVPSSTDPEARVVIVRGLGAKNRVP